MYEVDFTGWTKDEETLEKLNNDWKYRWSLHFTRFRKAIKQRRWWYFTWWNIKGLLFNQKQQF